MSVGRFGNTHSKLRQRPRLASLVVTPLRSQAQAPDY